MSKQLAAILAGGLALLSLGLSLAISGALSAVLAGYGLLNIAYSVWLKHVVIADVFCIAIGFVLRVIAGGLAIDVQHRERADAGIAFEGVRESIVTTSVATSLPLPGFSRHVLAVRGAYGVTGHRAASGFGVGGVSGSTLEVLPGVAIGSARRTFGVLVDLGETGWEIEDLVVDRMIKSELDELAVRKHARHLAPE